MIPDDISTVRRISQLETLVADLSRELSTLRSVAPDAIAPRERWLGRTTSASFSDYPTSGDTFQVELLACHFTPSPGAQAITEVSLGDKVVARTRPGTYLPRGTEVEVYRCRGMGPLGSGEWWISGGAASSSSSRCVITGAVESGALTGSVWRPGMILPGPTSWQYPTSAEALHLFPDVAGDVANAGGDVFRVRSPASSWAVPGTHYDAWLELVAQEHYELHCHTTWYLGSLTYSEMLAAMIDNLAHAHGGAGATSNAKRPDDHFVQVVTTATITGSGYGRTVEVGRSSIPIFRNDGSLNSMPATHGGVAYLGRPTNATGPLSVRLSSQAFLSVSVAGSWVGSTFRAFLTQLQTSVHQTSG